jgi:hypothetical protein
MRNRSSGFDTKSLINRPTLVLRLNQETCAPYLHMHGVDRTWRHPTSRSSGHQVPDLCDYSGPVHHVSYSCHNPHRCTSCRSYGPRQKSAQQPARAPGRNLGLGRERLIPPGLKLGPVSVCRPSKSNGCARFPAEQNRAPAPSHKP